MLRCLQPVRGRLKECPSHSELILTIPCSGSLGNAFQAISHFRLDRGTSCYWNAEHSLTEQTDEEHLFEGICSLVLEGQVTKEKKIELAFSLWQNGFTAVGFSWNLSLYKSKDSEEGNLREHIFGQMRQNSRLNILLLGHLKVWTEIYFKQNFMNRKIYFKQVRDKVITIMMCIMKMRQDHVKPIRQ